MDWQLTRIIHDCNMISPICLMTRYSSRRTRSVNVHHRIVCKCITLCISNILDIILFIVIWYHWPTCISGDLWEDLVWSFTPFESTKDTIGFRYSVVQYMTILHYALQWQQHCTVQPWAHQRRPKSCPGTLWHDTVFSLTAARNIMWGSFLLAIRDECMIILFTHIEKRSK